MLVADPDTEFGKATANTLVDWGLQPILAHDGVEAILSIQRTLPRVVVLDAALPKMFGFQICELMKRNESLREIAVVLIGAIHDRARYRRAPGDLYGADAYLERHQLPDGLYPLLEGLGLPVSGGPSPEAAAAAPVPPPPVPSTSAPSEESSSGVSMPPPTDGLGELRTPSGDAAASPDAPPPTATPPAPVAPPAAPSVAPPEPDPPPPVPGPDFSEPTREMEVPEELRPPAPPAPDENSELAEEIAKAERLARIIVSDIALYNQEKFDAAVAAGTVADAMQSEVEEGRALLSQRIAPEVLATRDFLIEELLRVAGSRGPG